MRDPLTGEDITDDPDRWIDWREDPMLGRWAGPEGMTLIGTINCTPKES
jgi:hypothetical protein